jgi:hypothetical protein
MTPEDEFQGDFFLPLAHRQRGETISPLKICFVIIDGKYTSLSSQIKRETSVFYPLLLVLKIPPCPYFSRRYL